MPPLSDGDIYPNEGGSYQAGLYYPEKPKQRVAAEADQKAPAAGSLPIMPKIAEWFDQQVAACNDPDSIQVTTLTVNGVKYSRTVSVEAQVLAMQLLKAKLNEKAHEFSKYMEAADE